MKSKLFNMELFMSDRDTNTIFEITQEEGFYYTQFMQHSLGSKAPDFPSYSGVCQFMWAMCKEMSYPQPKGYGYAVVLKGDDGENDKLCGHVRLYNIDYEAGTAARAAFVGTQYQRMGIAKEALMELTKAAFEDLGLKQIIIQVDPENTPSVRNIVNSFDAIHQADREIEIYGFDEPQLRSFYEVHASRFLLDTYPDYIETQAKKAQAKDELPEDNHKISIAQYQAYNAIFMPEFEI